jgi:tetratricopeptide (TPR) repeat protein
MQYIEGQPLDQVLAELRRLGQPGQAEPSAIAASLRTGQFAALPPPDPREPRTQPMTGPPTTAHEPRLPSPGSTTSSLRGDSRRQYPRTVARLGSAVADALEYAAGQGVLHRDIKPSNLLLDVWGHVWVADFGLAKATGQEDLTHTGDVIGTLRYMAPERFRGQADIRSDVYALGLTLYEMLALQPAFDAQDRARLIDQVLHTPPPRLDRLDHSLPGDLVTIVHKAIAPDPGDRYGSAGALADDLHSFLQDRPIAARRASRLELARRWCRRNPVVALLLLLLGVTAVGVAVASLAVAWRMDRLARAAEAARADEQVAREQLERRQGEILAARREADRNAGEAGAVLEFLSDDLIGAAAPESKRGRPLSVDEVLARAGALAGRRFEARPLVEAAVALAVGTTYEKLGQDGAAEKHYRRALELRRRHLGADHPATMIAQTRLARMHRHAGRAEQGLKLQEPALAVLRRALGPAHRETLLAQANLAVLRLLKGRPAEAEKLLRATVEAQQRLLGHYHEETLHSRSMLAAVYRIQGRLDESVVLFDQTRQGMLHGLGAEHPRTLACGLNLALQLEGVGKLRQAQALCAQVLPVFRRVMGEEDSGVVTLAHLHARLAWHLGPPEKALALLEAACRREEGLAPDNPLWLDSLVALAELHAAAGRHARARPLFEQAAGAWGRLARTRPVNLIDYTPCASALAHLGRHREAAGLLDEALRDPAAAPQARLEAARALARCAAAAAKDGLQARDYHCRALSLLERCRDAGYFDRAGAGLFLDEPAFKALRATEPGQTFARSLAPARR